VRDLSVRVLPNKLTSTNREAAARSAAHLPANFADSDYSKGAVAKESTAPLFLREIEVLPSADQWLSVTGVLYIRGSGQGQRACNADHRKSNEDIRDTTKETISETRCWAADVPTLSWIKELFVCSYPWGKNLAQPG
jgi:hypothetical protein